MSGSRFMIDPYPRICRELREPMEAERNRRARRAYRSLAFWLGAAVFLALALVVGLAARGDSGTWRLPVDNVCAVEVSHVYDGDGNKTLSQTCYMDFYWWLPEPRYYYRAWRQIRDPNMIPVRDYQRGGYVAIWLDGGQLRVVRCLSVFRSDLQYDPEIAERAIHPTDARRELFQRFELPKAREEE